MSDMPESMSNAELKLLDKLLDAGLNLNEINLIFTIRRHTSYYAMAWNSHELDEQGQISGIQRMFPDGADMKKLESLAANFLSRLVS